MVVDIGGIDVVVTRKQVKNLNVRILASSGKVVASVPFDMPRTEIERFLLERAPQIASMRTAVLASPQRRAEDADAAQIREWRIAVQAATELFAKRWEPVLGVHAKGFSYRNMKTRWGSCTPSTGSIRINVRLALYPPECLEYIVVHELCHLIETGHGPRFRALLDRHLPDWKRRRELLRF